MASFFQGTDPDIDPGGAAQSAELAKDWAIKADGPVEGSSYSSLYNANIAEGHANDAADSAALSVQAAGVAQDAADQLGSLVINDLQDVDAAAPNDGDVLVFETASGTWKPAAPVVAVNQNVQSLWDRITVLEETLRQSGLIP
jgi:hypothetical protein